MDKVSVIIPCFNDGAYIEEAIESAKSQTYPSIEIIIIDDGSDDVHTQTILSRINDSNIRIIRKERVLPAAARNAGISVAEGKYILPLDADDKIEPDYIAKAVKIMQSNHEIGVVYCQADFFGDKSGRWELPAYSLDKMLLDNIVFVTALFYKSDWERVGGFNTVMSHGMEDYDFWLSILELDREIYQIPEVLFHYRIKSNSRTKVFQENLNHIQQTYRDIYFSHTKLYKKHADKYAIILREALIDQIYMNKSLKESIAILNRLNKLPVIKSIIKKFIMR